MNDTLDMLRYLACPATRQPLRREGMQTLVNQDGSHRYRITPSGIPLFAEKLCSAEGRIQQAHYDAVSQAYTANLNYPHTRVYSAYLDAALRDALEGAALGDMAELCCGRGEALRLFDGAYRTGIGVDVSAAMLQAGHDELPADRVALVQGDATMLPLRDDCFDSVLMLGGIHHVNDRVGLFREVRRILKPGGLFVWREPVSDFAPWRWLRAVIYRLSPALDHETESPLRRAATMAHLAAAGLEARWWRTYGFFGFCVMMNSDVLVFNRAFRFLPGIEALTRGAVRLDEATLTLPGLANAGLQVIGTARKPA